MPTYRVQTDTGVLRVESSTPITSEPQMQQLLNSPSAGVTITPEAPTQPVSQSFFQRLNAGLVRDKQAGIQRAEQYLTERLKASGMAPKEVDRRVKAASSQLQSASPGSLGDVGRFMLPFLVGGLVPAGRTVGRMGGQVLGNVLGSAGIGAGEEALSGGSPLQGAMRGSFKGLPGGLMQGAIGGVLGPNKATIQAQQASATARLKGVFSPSVSAVIPPGDPKAIFSKGTIQDMVKTAGRSLDQMEQTIRTDLAPKPGLGQKGLQSKFDYMRNQIKALRDVGEGPRTTPELRGAAKKASISAAKLEDELVQMLKNNGFQDQAKLYLDTISQYAKDRANIRVLKAIQQSQNLPGGVNRADNPAMAELTDALQAPSLGPAARATFMTALVALRHPFMALHFARSGLGKGFMDPHKVQVPPLGKLAGPLGAVGGAAASLTAKDEPAP